MCCDCNVFKEDLNNGIIYFKESKIWLKATNEILHTNFGKGDIKKLKDDKIEQSSIL